MESDRLTTWISTVVIGIVPKHRRPQQAPAAVPAVDIQGLAKRRFAAAAGGAPAMSEDFARAFSADQ